MTAKTSAATVDVTIQNMAYAPDPVQVKVGGTVRWTNKDNDTHTVTSNPGTLGCDPPSTENFDSGNMNLNDHFPHTFSTPGSFAYHCEIHGCAMSGTVQVTA